MNWVELIWLVWPTVWKWKVVANSGREWWGWRKHLRPEQWDPEINIGPCSKLLCKTGTELKRSLLLPLVFSYCIVSRAWCCRHAKNMYFVCGRCSFAKAIWKIFKFCVMISFKCEQGFGFFIVKRTVYMKRSSITAISGSLILKTDWSGGR